MENGAGTQPRDLRQICVAALAIAISIYLLDLLIFGRFPSIDETFFKSAGREWAQSGRFAAPEIRGFLGLSPPVETVWFAQLPVYTFLFGLLTAVFGFGPTLCVMCSTAVFTPSWRASPTC